MTSEPRSPPDASPEERRVARDLLEEVRAAQAAGRRRTWRKVTTLLGRFGVYRLTPKVRERIAAALREAGLEVEPSFAEVSRSGTVRLSIAAQQSGSATGTAEVIPTPRPPRAQEVIRASVWPSEGLPRSVELAEVDLEDGLAWYDVDILKAEEASVWKALAPRCPGLTLAVLEDLFKADDLPGIKSYADSGRRRAVSAVSVHSSDLPRDTEAAANDPALSRAEQLEFQLVEIVVGEGWVLTAWHEREVFREGNPEPVVPKPEPAGYESIRSLAAQHWEGGQFSSAADLGILILRGLTGTYLQAQRDLYSWLDLWDAAFYIDGAATERQTPVELQHLVTEFRRRLTPLTQSGLPAERKWFDGLSRGEEAAEVERSVAICLNELRDLAREIRGSFDLLATTGAQRQLQLAEEGQSNAERQRRQNERFQEILTVIAAVLLMPTLVATIYGANVEVPGRDSLEGFVVMLVVMALSAVATFVVVRLLRRRRRSG